MKEKYRICEMAKHLKVSVSGYYSWLNRPKSDRDRKDEILKKEIKDIFDESRKT